jgi:hypothetical protein
MQSEPHDPFIDDHEWQREYDKAVAPLVDPFLKMMDEHVARMLAEATPSEQSCGSYDDADILTAEDILRVATQLRKELGPQVVGITARRDTVPLVERVRREVFKSDLYGSSPVIPEMYGIPVYEKADQDAPWKVWYDETAMREYLKETNE